MNGDPRYKAILDEMWELHDSKALAYGNTGDPLANLRSGERFAVPAWKRCLVEADSAFFRLENYCNGRNADNDSVENALKDAAAFCMLALLFIREGNERAKRFLLSDRELQLLEDSVTEQMEEMGAWDSRDELDKTVLPTPKDSRRPVTNPEWMDGVSSKMQATLEAAK